MPVRTKFQVVQIIEHVGGKQVKMSAVSSTDPDHENKVFSDYTPSGSIEFAISAGKPAISAFAVGKEYYVDFTLTE